MKDIHIREALIRQLQTLYASEPRTLVVQEMGLCRGDARVDLAVINGHLHGYEIKSDEDNLDRLPSQRDLYGRVFDRITIVASGRHLREIRGMVPGWWGISQAEAGSQGVEIRKVRNEKPNPKVDPRALVQLLWRDEVLEKLRLIGLHKGIVDKPRKVLWAKLVKGLSADELALEVRNRLRSRKSWRPDR